MDQGEQRDVTIDLGAMLRAMRRARAPLLAVALLTGTAVVVATSPFTWGHRAAVRLAVAQPAVAPGIAVSAPGLAASAEAEAGRLASPAFLARVLARPGFPAAQAALPAGLDPIAVVEDVIFGPPAGERALRRFASRLSVTPGDEPATLDVAWTGFDSATAAAVVEGLAAEWVADAEQRLAGRPSADPSAAAAALRRELADLEARRAMVAESTADARRGVDDLSTRIEQEKAERSRLEARLPVLSALASNGSGLATATELAESPVLRRLRERKTEVAARLNQLSDTYLAEHPLMKAARAEATDLERQIRSEAGRIATATRSELALVRARIDRMEARADEVETDPIVTGSIAADTGGLDRRSADLRRRLSELLERAAAAPADADRPRRLTPVASADTGPVALGVRGLAVGLAVWIAGLLCVGFGALRSDRRAMPSSPLAARRIVEEGSVVDLHHRLEAAFPTPEPEVAVAAPVAASTAEAEPAPAVVEPIGVDAGFLPPVSPELLRPVRRAPESIHRIWEDLAARGPGIRRILVVGAEDAGCARRAAAALLQAASIAGETACCVDLAPAEDAAPQTGRAVGLSDLLAGTTGFGEAIVRDRVSRGHLIGAGSRRLGARALSHPGVERIVTALERVYDRVILDVGIAERAVVDLVASADVVVLAADTAMPEAEIARARIALVTAGAGLVVVADADRLASLDDAA
jgi:uncharacterized protein involved in exopolysaccharide biosynthesis